MTNNDVGFPTVKRSPIIRQWVLGRFSEHTFRSEDSPTDRKIHLWTTPSGSKLTKFPSKLRKATIFTRIFLISHTFRQLSANRLSPFIHFPPFYDTLHDRHICQTAFTRTRIAPNFPPSTASAALLSQKSYYFPSWSQPLSVKSRLFLHFLFFYTIQ